jgi:hypothetical protein
MANDVAAPMPQIDLQDQSTITVTLSDPGATITSLVIHGWQVVQDASPPLPGPSSLVAGGAV